jgi:hypothetical protein
VADKNNKARGHVKGQPRRFVVGHGTRKSPVEYLVDEGTDCWVWQMHKNNKGYGVLKREGKRRYAHIVNYEKINGPVPEGLELDHICRNRACVNPSHLEAVTHQINQRRAAKLTVDQVKEIKDLNSKGIGYRRLAKMFNVHRSTICHLVTERIWK